MKKTIFFALLVAAITTVSSCKCHTCTCNVLGSSTTNKVCRDAYNTTADYNNVVQSYENAGCSCKLSNWFLVISTENKNAPINRSIFYLIKCYRF